MPNEYPGFFFCPRKVEIHWLDFLMFPTVRFDHFPFQYWIRHFHFPLNLRKVHFVPLGQQIYFDKIKFQWIWLPVHRCFMNIKRR